MYCYSTNGFYYRIVDDSYIAKSGEYLSQTNLNDAELDIAFPQRQIILANRIINQQINDINDELANLDIYIPRGLEDTWTALNINITTLPEIQQTRLAQKQTLRKQLANLLTQIQPE